MMKYREITKGTWKEYQLSKGRTSSAYKRLLFNLIGSHGPAKHHNPQTHWPTRFEYQQI